MNNARARHTSAHTFLEGLIFNTEFTVLELYLNISILELQILLSTLHKYYCLNSTILAIPTVVSSSIRI